MKQYLGLLLIIPILSSCKSSTDAPNAVYNLEEIYQSGSEENFTAYLLKWHSRSNPISADEFEQLSDTLKAVYEIYETFYNPLDLNCYCTTGRCPEFGPGVYQDLNFFIVQSKISFDFTSDKIKNLKETIFCPHLKFNQLSLYLSDEYRDELDAFLDREIHPDDLQERYEFVSKQLKIFPGHGFGWQYLTYPAVDFLFSHNLLIALQPRRRSLTSLFFILLNLIVQLNNLLL